MTLVAPRNTVDYQGVWTTLVSVNEPDWCHFAPFLPHFSTPGHYIRAVAQRQPAFQLIVVVQGLRGLRVAQFGRIVAEFRSYKSNSYSDFLVIY